MTSISPTSRAIALLPVSTLALHPTPRARRHGSLQNSLPSSAPPLVRTPAVSPSLLERVQLGQPDAVQHCIDAYGGLLWSMAKRACADASEAEDAVQEIFLELWRSAGRYDPQQGSEVTFIMTIARRRLIDRYRRRRPPLDGKPVEELPSGARDHTEATEVRDEAARAQRAMLQLSAEQREVLEMSIWQGLTQEQIAARTGKPLGTVKSHARRGLERMRELLGRGADGQGGRS